MCPAPPFARLAYMPPPVPEQLSRTIETLYRSESGRVLATLVRLLGYLDLAEESMHEAFAAAFVLEARDMNHAVQLMAQHPAMTYGNIFEIRPAGDMNEIMKASEQRRRQVAAP